METQLIVPTKAGQICQLVNPLEDENPSDVYIVAENPEDFDDDDNLYVVNLREVQRNINNPAAAPQIAVVKCELSVLAENLGEYVQAWNK